MTLDWSIVATWAASTIVIFQYGQIAMQSAWMLYHHTELATREETIDMAATLVVAVACMVTQFISSSRALVACQGIEMKLLMIGVVYGMGRYVAKSLDRRMRWYMFCIQENQRIRGGDHASVS